MQTDNYNTCKINNPENCLECVFNNIFFGKLNDEELKLINKHKSGKDFKKGEIIVKQGDKVEYFLFLKTGLAKLFYSGKQGKNDQILSISKPMDCIGMFSIFSNSIYQFSIAAIEDSNVCFVEIDILKSIIEKNGKFAMCFLDKMSSISELLLQNRIDISSKHMRGRVASILLNFADNIYNSDTFDLPISRKEISELIELSTENVIRLLSELRKDKIINIEGKTISIIEREKLEIFNRLG